MPALPCNAPTSQLWAGATVSSGMSPWRRQSARPPETHNALAPSQKHQRSLLTMSPRTTIRPYPPLPGKCDGGEGAGQFQHHLALCCGPGRWPESGPGSVHRQPLRAGRTCAGSTSLFSQLSLPVGLGSHLCWPGTL